jgi:hypothetical protein
MSHAVPAGSREVTVAFNFISELNVQTSLSFQLETAFKASTIVINYYFKLVFVVADTGSMK